MEPVGGPADAGPRAAHRLAAIVLILRMITAGSVEKGAIEHALFKHGLQEKSIRTGMFNESSKGSERQAMLRELLRVEEAVSDGKEADDGGMRTDEKINRLLGRSEGEFELSTDIDKKRAAERGSRPKLFTEKEVPLKRVKRRRRLLVLSG